MGCFCFSKKKIVQKDEKGSRKKVQVAKERAKERTTFTDLVDNFNIVSDSFKHRTVADEVSRIGNGNAVHVRIFTYAELVSATENFKAESLIGEGGFGRVYKGYLNDTKQDIAVKQLDKNGLQGNREFLVEVLMLSCLRNSHLVNLIGYCADGDQRLLVYEYMVHGSLEDHLLDLAPNKKPLDWNTRMKIATGAAKGLEYLHDSAKPPVIFRDFKASNILLNESFNSRLSDFGLARYGPSEEGKQHVSTRVMGTYGYCAPEYALTGQLTTMSDVYSFGVVFLEIITGRRAVDVDLPSSEQHLVQWAEPLFRDKKRFVEMADPLLEGNFPKKGLYQALAVAGMCLQEDDTSRPSISDVVTALEYLAAPKPESVKSSPSRDIETKSSNESEDEKKEDASSHS